MDDRVLWEKIAVLWCTLIEAGFNSILDHMVGGMRYLRVIGRVSRANIGTAGLL
jgi:hypothetical protein